jgi:hypothetical protein
MAQADSDNSIPAPDAEKPQDSLYLPTDMTPEEIFRAIGNSEGTPETRSSG